MDTELFALAVEAALRIPSSGIGTLSEKKVHGAIKYYIQPDMEKHEIKHSGFVCDALSDDGVYEIQTRAFYRLARKLPSLLLSGTVTVVYPIIAEKRLYITDSETGEVTVRKSPKKQSFYSVFAELYSIRKFLVSENLRLRLITIGAEEHRVVKKSLSRRRRERTDTVLSETVPVELYGDITLTCPEDYRRQLPDDLPTEFTSADLAKSAKIRRSLSSVALLVLTDLKVVERIGKKGNAFVYTFISNESSD